MIDFSKHSKLEAFRGLPQCELDLMSIHSYQAGAFLIQETQITEHMLFLLLSGVCIADRLTPWEENFFSTYRVLPGEFIGLYEVIAPRLIKRSVSVRAKTPVSALSITGTQLMRWQTQYPSIYNWIITEVLSSQYRKHTILINTIRLNTSVGGAYYLSKLYLEYRDACYPPEFHGSVKIWETHAEISNALACDIRSVDRIVHEFSRMGLIDCVKKKIHIDSKQNNLLIEYIRSHS